MTKMRIKILTIILFSMAFLGLKAQEDHFKEMLDTYKSRVFCFYPSTLRMINIGNAPEFDKLVNGIDKLLIYKTDSAFTADKVYLELHSDYKSKAYDEILFMEGGGNEASVLYKEMGSNSEYVGYFKQEDMFYAFLLKGEIKWDEIPSLINTFKDGDFVNVLDLSKN